MATTLGVSVFETIKLLDQIQVETGADRVFLVNVPKIRPVDLLEIELIVEWWNDGKKAQVAHRFHAFQLLSSYDPRWQFAEFIEKCNRLRPKEGDWFGVENDQN